MKTPTNNAIRIALADDHALVRKGIKEILTSFGFEICIDANNGQELLDELHVIDKLPDICVIDISMPVMDGYDTLAAIKKEWPHMRVLILTMFNNEHNIIRMLRNGASGYFLKNSDPDELKKAIQSIYDTGFYHSELVSNNFFKIMSDTASLPKFKDKEQQFLKYCCSDLTYDEISKKMFMSVRSVEGYRDQLFRKLNVNSRTGLALWAIRMGLVPIE